jgi:hypothetical protein
MPRSSTARTLKLEPRLVQELAAAQAARAGNKLIPVTIELATPLQRHAGVGRMQTIKSVELRNHRLQQKLVARLVELGARRIQQIGLVNAVSAELKPAQIPRIAAHPDVRIVRLAWPERVTTG